MTIATRLAEARRRVDAACVRAERDPAGVEVLPVSKWHPASAIVDAHEAGWRRFGESRPQELRDKAVELGSLHLGWVAIGHLQTNKTTLVADHAEEFQALDSVRLARVLDRRLVAAGRRLRVLIEVNTSGEPAKGGFPPDAVEAAVREIRQCEALDVGGLMTLAVRSADPEPVRACFTTLRATRDRLRDTFSEPFDTLSMGMSGDYELAVECGATCVRLGTSIFGPRPTA